MKIAIELDEEKLRQVAQDRWDEQFSRLNHTSTVRSLIADAVITELSKPEFLDKVRSVVRDVASHISEAAVRDAVRSKMSKLVKKMVSDETK